MAPVYGVARGKKLLIGKLLARAAYFVFVVLAGYALAEAIYSVGFYRGWFGEAPAGLIVEQGEHQVRFHPEFGYTLPPAEMRLAFLGGGEVDYAASVKGNSLGFMDSTEFTPLRTDAATLRLAVFGDSYSATWYLKPPWPDKVEELAKAEDHSVEMLNFSQTAGGICNWWSIITRHIGPEHYELDGLIFAIYGDDLDRGFVSMTTTDNSLAVAETPYYRDQPRDPRLWPSHVAEVESRLRFMGSVLPSEAFERALQEGNHNPWKLRLWREMRDTWRAFRLKRSAPGAGSEVASSKMRLYEDIARFAEERSLPVLVLRVPHPRDLVAPLPVPAHINEFAAALGAPVFDGVKAFVNPERPHLRHAYDSVADFYMVRDGHWNQAGSNRFARHVFQFLKQELLDRRKNDVEKAKRR